MFLEANIIQTENDLNAHVIFMPLFTDTLTYKKGSPAEASDSTPVVAGVLGAVVVLAIVIAIAIVVMKRHNLDGKCKFCHTL